MQTRKERAAQPMDAGRLRGAIGNINRDQKVEKVPKGRGF